MSQEKKPKFRPITLTFTPLQLDELTQVSRITGLKKVEIVRRALDVYLEKQLEVDFRRRRRQQKIDVFQEMFSPERLREITVAAKSRGISEIDYLRQSVDNELKVEGD